MKDELALSGVHTHLYEPLKLLVDCASLGMTGKETAEYLRHKNIECEFADSYDLVLMITPQNTNADFARIQEALTELPGKKSALIRDFPVMPKPERVCRIREAILAPSVRIPVEEASGCVCASPSVSCPPAVPVAISGERLTDKILSVMKWYGINDIDVIAR